MSKPGYRIAAAGVGIFLSLLAVELTLRLAGFVYARLYLERPDPRGADTYRILCLGESTTALGEENSYPSQLETILNEKGKRKFTVFNGGVPGTTTSRILARLDADIRKFRPRMVICMMGINEPEGRPRRETAELIRDAFGQSRVCQLLGYIRSAAASRMVSAFFWNAGRRLWEQEEFGLAETAFTRAITIFPADWRNYYELGAMYNEAGHSLAALRVLKKGHELNPNDQGIVLELAAACLDRRDFVETERLCAQALSMDPSNHDVYALMFECKRQQGRKSDAESALRLDIRNNPDDCQGYLILGDHLSKTGDPEAEELFRRAAELEDDHPGILYGYGKILLANKKYDLAQQVFERVGALDPDDDLSRAGRAWCLYYRGIVDQAETVFEELSRKRPGCENLTAAGRFFTAVGNHRKAEKLLRAALASKDKEEHMSSALEAYRTLRELYAITGDTVKGDQVALAWKAAEERGVRVNYNRLRERLRVRGIRLVCVQYPLRRVGDLKGYFQDTGGIAFVDNERVFSEAVERAGYDAVFIDDFAVDFGHCTPYGNRLLADTVATIVLREVPADE